nr:hypothetical protein [Cryobacterium sp. TMT1-19]
MVEVFLRDQRTQLGAGVHPGAKLHAGDPGRHFLDEFGLALLVDIEPRVGRADLPGIEHAARQVAADGRVDVGVRSDDGGGLAPEFEGDLLEVRGGGAGHDGAADGGGTGTKGGLRD